MYFAEYAIRFFRLWNLTNVGIEWMTKWHFPRTSSDFLEFFLMIVYVKKFYLEIYLPYKVYILADNTVNSTIRVFLNVCQSISTYVTYC